MPFSNLQLWNRINENNALIYSIPSGGTSSNTTYTGLNNFVNTLKYYGNQIALFHKVRYVNEGELMSPHLADSAPPSVEYSVASPEDLVCLPSSPSRESNYLYIVSSAMIPLS